jgi:peptidyl-Asp metalloendopeptidase
MDRNRTFFGIFGAMLLFMSASLKAGMFEYLPDSYITTNTQLNYVSGLKKKRTGGTVRRIKMNMESLTGTDVEVSLKPYKTDLITDVHIDKISDSEYNWSGTLSGIPGGAVFVVSDGMVTGTLRTSDGLYRIQPLERDVHALIKVDESEMHEDETELQLISKYNGKYTSFERMTFEDNTDYSVLTNTITNIDVLVLVTQNAQRNYGSNIDQLLKLAIHETNTSFSNSRINIKLNLAGSIILDKNFDDSHMSFSQILFYMVADFDNYLNDLYELRKQYSADIVVLVTGSGDLCGRAAAINARASNAYAVVHYDCMTGRYTFGHEIGHLLGARHNPEEDSSTRPYPQGHGFRYDPFWRTMMSYNCPQGCKRIPYWSNPDVIYEDVATGTFSLHNNASVLNLNAYRVSRFSDSL